MAATPSRRRPFALLIAAALFTGLLVPLVATAAPASASSAMHRRTLTERSIGRAVHRLINAERALYGRRKVHMNPHLLLSARHHDETMARTDLLSHQLQGEPAMTRRMQSAGYHWMWAAENIGYSTRMTLGSVLALEKEMFNERPPNNGHRVNILGSHYRDVGVDVYFDRQHHRVWLTVDFGKS